MVVKVWSALKMQKVVEKVSEFLEMRHIMNKCIMYTKMFKYMKFFILLRSSSPFIVHRRYNVKLPLLLFNEYLFEGKLRFWLIQKFKYKHSTHYVTKLTLIIKFILVLPLSPCIYIYFNRSLYIEINAHITHAHNIFINKSITYKT